MAESSKAVQSLVRSFRRTIETFGWVSSSATKDVLNVTEATLMVILRSCCDQMRGKTRPATDIVDEIRQSAPFADLELSLILNTLLFIYDKDLLIRSKNLISRAWMEVDENFLGRVNENIRKNVGQKIYPPQERTDGLGGLSLAVTFEYPPRFQEALRDFLDPVCRSGRALYCTAKPHFTVLNIGTDIPLKRIRDVRSTVEERFGRSFHLRSLAHSVCTCARIRSETRLMPDGSIVLFGSGAFLEGIHELRLELREDALSLDLESILKKDAQPVWTHTTFARMGDHPIGMDVINQLCARYQGFQRDWPQERQIELVHPALGLVTFRDRKAILFPEISEICSEIC